MLHDPGHRFSHAFLKIFCTFFEGVVFMRSVPAVWLISISIKNRLMGCRIILCAINQTGIYTVSGESISILAIR